MLEAEQAPPTPFSADWAPRRRDLTEAEQRDVAFLLARKGELTPAQWALSPDEVYEAGREHALEPYERALATWANFLEEDLAAEVAFERQVLMAEQDQWLVPMPAANKSAHLQALEWSLDIAFCLATGLAVQAGLVGWIDKNRRLSDRTKAFELLVEQMKVGVANGGLQDPIAPAAFISWLRPIAHEIRLDISGLQRDWRRFAPEEVDPFMERQRVMALLGWSGKNTLNAKVAAGDFPRPDRVVKRKSLWRRSTVEQWKHDVDQATKKSLFGRPGKAFGGGRARPLSTRD